jgi:hypothetical protein
MSVWTTAIICGMCSVARGYFHAGSMRSTARSSKKYCAYFAVYSLSDTPSRAAPAMVLSSTSVMFMTL